MQLMMIRMSRVVLYGDCRTKTSVSAAAAPLTSKYRALHVKIFVRRSMIESGLRKG